MGPSSDFRGVVGTSQQRDAPNSDGGKRRMEWGSFGRSPDLGPSEGLHHFNGSDFCNEQASTGFLQRHLAGLFPNRNQRPTCFLTWTPGLERLRSAATGRNAPASLGTVLRQIDQAIIEFCQRGQERDLQNVLIAVGRAERWLATSSLRKGDVPCHAAEQFVAGVAAPR